MYKLLAKIYARKIWGNILLFGILDAIGIITIATIYNMVSLGQSNNTAPDIFIVNNAISPTHYLPSWYESKVSEQVVTDQVTSLTPLSVFVDDKVATFNVTDRNVYVDLFNVEITPYSELPDTVIPENTIYISRDLEEFTIDQGTKLAVYFSGITGLNNATLDFFVAGYIEELNGSDCKYCIIANKDVFENYKGYPSHVVSQLLFSTSANQQVSDVPKSLDELFINERYRTKTVPLSQLESRLKITFRSIGESLTLLAIVIGMLLITLKFIEIKFIDNVIRTIEKPLYILGCTRIFLSFCRWVLIGVQVVIPLVIATITMRAVLAYLFDSVSVLVPLFRFNTGVLGIMASMAVVIILFNFVGMIKRQKHLVMEEETM